ncbi:roadblock/LC7 domain-containing protein [Petrachloros mirabilis]
MISQSVKIYFLGQLQTLFKNCDVVDAAMVSTLDGRLCAEKQRADYPSERAAVMGSSLMALGDAIAKELSLGICDIIISENENGLVLFNHINEDFVLICVTASKSGLGSILSWARVTAQETAKNMPKVTALL